MPWPKSTELDDPEVEQCIDRTFGRMKFDVPAESGTTRVNYPLQFKWDRELEPASE